MGGAQSGKATASTEAKHVAVTEDSSASEVEEYIQYLRGFYDINGTLLAQSKWPPIRTIQFLDLALVEIVVKEQSRNESQPPDARKHAMKKRTITLDQVKTRESNIESILINLFGLSKE